MSQQTGGTGVAVVTGDDSEVAGVGEEADVAGVKWPGDEDNMLTPIDLSLANTYAYGLGIPPNKAAEELEKLGFKIV
ncbi:MAG: hypothetical protein PHZ04_03870 [Patescibacteria group bacterium]|nr:hypothetical protein [Patescibacteria group bacterium]MDD5295185.1 hypothetical protein [Patescibacteria group bacterium]MDD5554064.1 hypothetical protein [Patescibacteria group bacterium]